MMLRFATDENFNCVACGFANLDILRIQDTELYRADDLRVLDWVTQENRLLLTHDVQTMPDFSYQRINEDKMMRGIFVVDDEAPISTVIDNLLMIIEASTLEEGDNLVIHLPFK